jgi:acetyl esterase/lipase
MRTIILLIALGTFHAYPQERIIKLFPEGVPEKAMHLQEKADREGKPVAGEPVLRITDVDEPTVTVFNASEEVANGAAVIVCPGGAYNWLAYDLEGEEVCIWLSELGITAFLLKYRVPRRPDKPKHEAPLQDLQRAIGYIRTNADLLNIDPERIGVMGFSAGAHLAVMASTAFEKRTYPANQILDAASPKPDFCLLVYPAYLDGDDFNTAPEIHVSNKIPPTMIVQAEDDKDYINSALFYYFALKQAGVPAWMFLYSKGGHGYGLRDTGKAVNTWPDRAEDWFREIGVIE